MEDNRFGQIEQRLAALEAMQHLDFSGLKVFLKSIEVQGSIHLKEYSANPSPARTGDLAFVSGKLKLCTAGGSSPTWVVVGAQTA